jgi:hypothetical protein
MNVMNECMYICYKNMKITFEAHQRGAGTGIQHGPAIQHADALLYLSYASQYLPLPSLSYATPSQSYTAPYLSYAATYLHHLYLSYVAPYLSYASLSLIYAVT